MIRHFLLTLVALLALASAATAKTLVAVLPPDYPGPREALIEEFAKLIVGLGRADRLVVYSAMGPTQLATIAVPDDPRSGNAA